MHWYLVLLISTFFSKANAKVYYVTTDDHHTIDRNTYNLQHYLMNTEKYFTSNNQLHFLSGEHFLQKDFILQNAKKFTISGNNTIITCKNLPIGIVFTNVTRITLKDIKIVQCGKNHKVIFNASYDEEMDIHPHWASAMYINHCSIAINNISIMVKNGMNGIIAINVGFGVSSEMKNVHIHTECHNSTLSTNGILFYYFNYAKSLKMEHKINIFHYVYANNGLCCSSSALKALMMQETYQVYIKISESNFTHFKNSSVLHYFGKSCGNDKLNVIVRFSRCNVSYNKESPRVNLFHVIIHSQGDLLGSIKDRNHCDKQTNIISLVDCLIAENSNIQSLIHAILKNTLAFNLYIEVRHSKFIFNEAVKFISTQSELKALWQSSHYITMSEVFFGSNTHSYQVSLISSTNGLIKFSQNIIFKNNTCGNIMRLRLSVLKFKGYSEFSFNQARHILKSTEGSYCLLKGLEITTVVITNNFVYSVLDTKSAYDDNLNEVCYFQFIKNRDERVENKKLNYKIIMINNTYTAPEHILTNISSMKCTWFKGTIFSTNESQVVLEKLIKIKRISANSDNIGAINSSICLCKNTHSIDCSEHKLGSIFPGQTLQVNLSVNIIEAKRDSSVMMVAKTKDLPSFGCVIVNVGQIAQAHLISGCNQYTYTIWSDKSVCELYLDIHDKPEIFYVDLKACPVGFSLQDDRKACHCDSNLNSAYISISSCNINDETVLRPANSWISADNINNSYNYHVARCPFDYCLPHSSHHNLSNTDSQCQFHRSGELCGQCQDGLSAVFGSSQCKQCTNYYLFIVIPIAIAGFIMVLLIFIFNLTVTDGSINIFILYANIVSINFSLFCIKHHFVDCCTVLSLMNLDLGFEICFYNGMDGYFKMWLQLAFPFYLISIAGALIFGSRYSTIIQRLTAHRVLHLLATLILLSYTKVLLAVCQVLFFFSRIIHLPTKHTKLVWSIDASISLTTPKFLVLYIICAILFAFILMFNMLLLFPRTLSRFRIVNTFKPLLDAFLGPYKDKFSFWAGIQLLLRAVFFYTSSFNHEISFTCGTIILSAMLCLQGVVQPFKSKFKNVQELLLMFNLLVLHSISTLNHNNKQATFYIMKTLINIVLFYFVTFIVCRCVMVTCGDAVSQKYKVMINVLRKQKHHAVLSPNKLSMQIPDVTYNYQKFREPLIELDY